jgi:hypothetical protein
MFHFVSKLTRAGRSGNGVTDQASLAELENNALVNLIELKERALIFTNKKKTRNG